MSLRGPATQHLHNEARRAEFDGMGGMGGMGGTEYQKCPLKIFILCEYIDKVYTYIYMWLKNAPKILMGFKIWCQVGGLGQNFQIYSR